MEDEQNNGVNVHPNHYYRRSIRLSGYDYSQAGVYFVTICTQNRLCLFGKILEGEMRLNDAGQIVAQEWIKTAQIRNEIELDEWVVMPNHFHGIVMISDPGTNVSDWRNQMIVPGEIFENRGLGDQPVAPTGARSRSLGAMVGGFKSAVTTRINKRRQTPGVKYWQRNYWERIIRNESELDMIREYIFNNPVLWESDKLHPDNQ